MSSIGDKISAKTVLTLGSKGMWSFLTVVKTDYSLNKTQTHSVLLWSEGRRSEILTLTNKGLCVCVCVERRICTNNSLCSGEVSPNSVSTQSRHLAPPSRLLIHSCIYQKKILNVGFDLQPGQRSKVYLYCSSPIVIQNIYIYLKPLKTCMCVTFRTTLFL